MPAYCLTFSRREAFFAISLGNGTTMPAAAQSAERQGLRSGSGVAE